MPPLSNNFKTGFNFVLRDKETNEVEGIFHFESSARQVIGRTQKLERIYITTMETI